jgi:hypothetical protein
MQVTEAQTHLGLVVRLDVRTIQIAYHTYALMIIAIAVCGASVMAFASQLYSRFQNRAPLIINLTCGLLLPLDVHPGLKRVGRPRLHCHNVQQSWP